LFAGSLIENIPTY